MDPGVEALLVGAALFAGFIDSILGGGGVITLPALLTTGLPPHAAIATNKVVGTGASSIATWNYARAGLVTRGAVWLWALSAAASAFGAMLVLQIDGGWISWVVLVVVLGLAVYALLAPRFGLEERPPRPKAWLVAGVASIAFYDGALGPGTGNLLLALWVFVGGLPLLRAAAHGRVLNFASNVGALAFWATTDLIDWRVGLLMAAGTVTGGWLGSRSNIRTEARWVRPLYVAVAFALVARMLLT